MVKKEFSCETCGDFESGIAICPQCGSVSKRVFRTPVGFSVGRAKRIDRILEGEFARRNISNYTNATGKPVVNYGSGEYNGIKAGWGKDHLSQIQHQYNTAAPISPPPMPTGPANLVVPTIDLEQKTKHPGWGAAVPTERMDLTPNE